MKKGLKRLHVFLNMSHYLYSKLMPWWRRDWNGGKARISSPQQTGPVNWCPDEEGIETEENCKKNSAFFLSSKLMPWWRRDWNSHISRGYTFKRNASKLMPWWRRDWNCGIGFCLASASQFSKLMPWWRRDWNLGVWYLTTPKLLSSKLMPWWRRDWNSCNSYWLCVF